MLAFNLAVFFRNLRGEEVHFTARNAHCEMAFEGGVGELQEHTDLTHHIAVTLTQGNLSCQIAFEEVEEEDTLENTEVDVRMVLTQDENELVLLQTSFKFEDIMLKPATGDEPEPDDGPLSA